MTIFGVNAFIPFLKHNQLLVVRRSKQDKQFGGMLGLPGGKIEEGESDHDALKRELGEEIGFNEVTISDTPSLISDMDVYDRHLTLRIYTVNIAESVLAQPFTPKVKDIDEVLLVTPKEFFDSLIEHDYPETETVKFKSFLKEQGFATSM